MCDTKQQAPSLLREAPTVKRSTSISQFAARGANRARYGMGGTDGGAAEACLLSQWPVWAVVAFPLQPADEAVRIGPTAIGQLARGVVVRFFFT